MSVAEKEEVCGHPLARQVGEPAVGVPIKKRPFFLSEHTSPPSRTAVKPSALEMAAPESAPRTSSSNESFLNLADSDANIITKGKGTISCPDQGMVNKSFTPSVTGKEGVLANGLAGVAFREGSDRGSVGRTDESQHQKHTTSEVQLASLQNGNVGHPSSLVKEERVDQVLPALSLAEPCIAVPLADNGRAYSSSNFGKIPNLDLNVPLDPVDSFDDLPATHEGSSNLYHKTVHYHTAEVRPMTPNSTISSVLCSNVDGNLNLSNATGPSTKHGRADFTLDLQLKPPPRPELGINWKGLSPAPELSLSLFGKHIEAPKAPTVSAAVKSEHGEVAKRISGEVATPASEKSPLEKIVKHDEPCNVNVQRTTLSIVSGNKEIASCSMVKKEQPEEPSQQHIQKVVEKAPPSVQESSELVGNLPKLEKTDRASKVSNKAGFDLNSEVSPNSRIHDRSDVAIDGNTIPTERLHDVVSPNSRSVVPEVEKSIKCEKNTCSIPSPMVAIASGQASPSIAKSLALEGKSASPAGESCEAVAQPSISIRKPAVCKPGEGDTDCKSVGQHCVSLQKLVASKPCDAHGECDAFQSSFVSVSSSCPESLVRNPQDDVAYDGMSQGSAEMDCSDDDNNTVSQLPTMDQLHVDSTGKSQVTEDGCKTNNLCPEIKKEGCNDTQQDPCMLSAAIKVHAHRPDDSECEGVKIHDGKATHSKEQHEGAIFVDTLVASDKTSIVHTSQDTLCDVKNTTGISSTDLRRSSTWEASASPKKEFTKQSCKASDNHLEKDRSPEMKSKRSRSPHGKRVADCSEGHAKHAATKGQHSTESQEGAKESSLPPKDTVLGKGSHLDGASGSHMNSQYRMVKSASERSEYHEKSKPDSFRTFSLQDERERHVDESHWQGVGYGHVNRNERWDRFLESEREKDNEECHGGRHAYNMVNIRRPDHRYGGRGAVPHGHPRKFRGPRMLDDTEIAFADDLTIGRRYPTEDEFAQLPRFSRRRRLMPMNDQIPGCVPDRFLGREIPDHMLLAHGHVEDLPDNLMEGRFFIPHPRLQHAQGDHVLVRRERSHSPVHFHRGRSPEVLNGRQEVLHRSPPPARIDRPRLYHHRYTNVRHHNSPFDRIANDRRGLHRSMRRFEEEGVEGDAFEPPIHPAQLAELQAEAELIERRKFGERRTFLRSSEESSVGNEDEMLRYPVQDDMVFAEGGGLRELEGRFRNRLGNRGRGVVDQEDGYRYRGPQGWCDGNPNGGRLKRRRY